MKMEITVPEVVSLIKGIREQPESLFEVIRENVKETVGHYLSEAMDVELTHFLGRERYERAGEDSNHRNGSYGRNFTLKSIGEVAVNVPRDRKGDFKTQVIPRSKQYEDELRRDLCVMFLVRISTRTLSIISERLIDRSISPSEISKASKELSEAVEQWRERDLSEESVKHIFVDGVFFPMRIDGTIERVSVLVAIGVTEDGYRMILGLQAGDKESAPNWREFFKDLKKRGLKAGNVTLGIMDGLSGLEKVFAEEFPSGKVQRCQVHVARNVLAKVPRKLKKIIGDQIRSIFYASSKAKALQFFEQFKSKWEMELPSAVKCLQGSLDACLAYLNFPEQEWICLRTTNVMTIS